MIFLDSLGKISYNLNNLNMNYVSGTVLKDLGKVPCIYFGDRTQAAVSVSSLAALFLRRKLFFLI